MHVIRRVHWRQSLELRQRMSCCNRKLDFSPSLDVKRSCMSSRVLLWHGPSLLWIVFSIAIPKFARSFLRLPIRSLSSPFTLTGQVPASGLLLADAHLDLTRKGDPNSPSPWLIVQGERKATYSRSTAVPAFPRSSVQTG